MDPDLATKLLSAQIQGAIKLYDIDALRTLGNQRGLSKHQTLEHLAHADLYRIQHPPQLMGYVELDRWEAPFLREFLGTDVDQQALGEPRAFGVDDFKVKAVTELVEYTQDYIHYWAENGDGYLEGKLAALNLLFSPGIEAQLITLKEDEQMGSAIAKFIGTTHCVLTLAASRGKHFTQEQAFSWFDRLSSWDEHLIETLPKDKAECAKRKKSYDPFEYSHWVSTRPGDFGSTIKYMSPKTVEAYQAQEALFDHIIDLAKRVYGTTQPIARQVGSYLSYFREDGPKQEIRGLLIDKHGLDESIVDAHTKPTDQYIAEVIEQSVSYWVANGGEKVLDRLEQFVRTEAHHDIVTTGICRALEDRWLGKINQLPGRENMYHSQAVSDAYVAQVTKAINAADMDRVRDLAKIKSVVYKGNDPDILQLESLIAS